MVKITAEAAEIGCAEIVHQHEDDVRLGSQGICGTADDDEQREENGKNETHGTHGWVQSPASVNGGRSKVAPSPVTRGSAASWSFFMSSAASFSFCAA